MNQVEEDEPDQVGEDLPPRKPVPVDTNYVIHWSDLETSVTFLPSYAEKCEKLVWDIMGYFLHPSAMLPHEPFLRDLIRRHEAGEISDTVLEAEAREHVRHIRNKEMGEGGWIDHIQHDETDYKRYENYGYQYRHKARERLVRALGYEPHIDHSMEAEFHLRNSLARDTGVAVGPLNACDVRMMAVVKYREILLTQGKAAADASPLFDYRPFLGKILD